MTARETRAPMMVRGAREETRAGGTSIKAHGGVEGGGSHYGDLAGRPRGTTDRDKADGGGDLGKLKSQRAQALKGTSRGSA
ncbi:hypothetical protein DPX16_17329 [Anabarilius grahami]|uniref:Uncharacterized protein n=1 Tax=Anabarilius grahami TaxID=495550 RepID=A0A3N0XZ25_ANAGA|nr:hypothetical protein DPX16_17329 [Anabarilius grahami]